MENGQKVGGKSSDGLSDEAEQNRRFMKDLASALMLRPYFYYCPICRKVGN